MTDQRSFSFNIMVASLCFDIRAVIFGLTSRIVEKQASGSHSPFSFGSETVVGGLVVVGATVGDCGMHFPGLAPARGLGCLSSSQTAVAILR